MALRQIMLRMQIDKKKSDLEALRNKDAEFETREKELETAIGEANTEEEQKAVEEAVNQYDQEKTAHDNAKAQLAFNPLPSHEGRPELFRSSISAFVKCLLPLTSTGSIGCL